MSEKLTEIQKIERDLGEALSKASKKTSTDIMKNTKPKKKDVF